MARSEIKFQHLDHRACMPSHIAIMLSGSLSFFSVKSPMVWIILHVRAIKVYRTHALRCSVDLVGVLRDIE